MVFFYYIYSILSGTVPDLNGEERADSDGQVDEDEEDGGRLVRLVDWPLAPPAGRRLSQFQQPIKRRKNWEKRRKKKKNCKNKEKNVKQSKTAEKRRKTKKNQEKTEKWKKFNNIEKN